MKLFVPILLGALGAAPAGAHEVISSVAVRPAVVVQLGYADGSPFAYESYELYAAGAAVPTQVGRTDAAGQVVFFAGATADWRLKAYTADGHGLDTRFSVAAADQPPAASQHTDRGSRLAIGAAVLFGLFGLLQLYLRRRRAE